MKSSKWAHRRPSRQSLAGIFGNVFQTFGLPLPPVTDSTIAPPKKAIFFNERFMAARHEEECYEKITLTHFHACKGLSNDDAVAASGTVFQEIRQGADFKTGNFAKE